MEVPRKYQTQGPKMWTNADWGRHLSRSRTVISRLVEYGVLTPQRYTLGGQPLYEPEYVKWALANVPEIVGRMSDQSVE